MTFLNWERHIGNDKSPCTLVCTLASAFLQMAWCTDRHFWHRFSASGTAFASDAISESQFTDLQSCRLFSRLSVCMHSCCVLCHPSSYACLYARSPSVLCHPSYAGPLLVCKHTVLQCCVNPLLVLFCENAVLQCCANLSGGSVSSDWCANHNFCWSRLLLKSTSAEVVVCASTKMTLYRALLNHYQTCNYHLALWSPPCWLQYMLLFYQ